MSIPLQFSHLPTARWTPQAATLWQRDRPWMVGCNFIPSTAGNQLEMWQADTFDPATIDREIGWAASLGMNAVRVYLHDLLWSQDAAGFLVRIETYLSVAWRHKVRTMFVLFDSCWGPDPVSGPQKAPLPGVHNSVWVQAPGMAALADPTAHGCLEDYVRGVVGAFADDDRVLAWDVWNEPDNGPAVNIHDSSSLEHKADLVLPLMIAAFRWAADTDPSQPLTSPIWLGDWSGDVALTQIQQVQLACSDVISFHNYGTGDEFAERAGWLARHGRPLLCTEFLARAVGSTFDAVLPTAQRLDVAAFCWGLVVGKTQTHLPWDSWQVPYPADHAGIWFHDVFHADGRPYHDDEASILRSITGWLQPVADYVLPTGGLLAGAAAAG
jgi:hypothetical protein